MATANSDGSIILSTKLDTSGVSKGLTDIKNKFAALRDQKVTFATLTQAIKDQSYVIKQLSVEHANLVAKGKGTSAQAVELKGRIDTLTAEMKEMQAAATTLGIKTQSAFTKMKIAAMTFVSYFIGIQTIFAAIRFSGEAGEFATQTEASIQRLVDVYGSASTAVGDFIDQNARALGMSKSAAASFSSVYGNLFSSFSDQETNAALTNAYLQMTAVVASKTGRTVEDVQERIRSGLLGNTEAIEDLGIFVNVKTIEMTDAFQRMADGKSWEQLDVYTQQQIRSMAILEQATAKYGDEVADTSATIRNKFNAAYQDFKNTWGQFINTILLPILKVLTGVFDIATAGMNVLMGKSGNILGDAQENADASSKTADNIDKQTDAQKDLNKEMKKTLAGFDDIQILSSETADNTSSDSDGGDFVFTAPDGSAYAQETSATLTAIMGFISVAMIAIGLILLLSGHPGWGIGFIIAGASLLTVTQASVSQEGVGIDVQNALTTALLIAGVAAIVIGIILCMCHRYVKGIALIALGAATVVGDIVINWDSIKNMLSDEKVATWVAVGGTIAIVLGILLCFAQQWWAGIGLIALGATALVPDVVVNWDSITTAIKDFVVENAGIIALISAGLLIIGILVCFVNLPLGIALIAAGAVGLVTVTALNWDSIVDWVKGAWEAVKGFWDEHIAPIFTAKFWLDLAKKCGNGLIDGFENAINGIICLFETMINWIVNGLNEISFDVPDWVPLIGGKTFGFNIPEVKFGRVSIPRLAEGKVIPPNREFLAILGDQKQGMNIEAPLQTIVDAFNIALQQNGGYRNSGNTEVVLEIDGREFGRAVVEQGNRENRRIGTKLVIA